MEGRSTEFRAQLLLQLFDDLAHNGFRLLVVHRLRLVRKCEGNGIALFARREMLSFINVEEFDLAEQFLFAR